jgi:cytochrome P450
VEDLARRYPTQVFLTLFGLPVSDRDQFIEWGELLVENASPAALELAATREVVESALALF